MNSAISQKRSKVIDTLNRKYGSTQVLIQPEKEDADFTIMEERQKAVAQIAKDMA